MNDNLLIMGHGIALSATLPHATKGQALSLSISSHLGAIRLWTLFLSFSSFMPLCCSFYPNVFSNLFPCPILISLVDKFPSPAAYLSKKQRNLVTIQSHTNKSFEASSKYGFRIITYHVQQHQEQVQFTSNWTKETHLNTV